MITSNTMTLTGQITFCLFYDNDEQSYEMELFTNLEELLQKTSEPFLAEYRKDNDAIGIKVFEICVYNTNNDLKTTSYIRDNGLTGFVSAEIDNKSLDSRLLENVKLIRDLADNALNGAPISKKRSKDIAHI